MWFICVFGFFVTSPVMTAVYTERSNICSLDEFQCGDGACISFEHICDGHQHCADGSDEASCDSNFDTSLGDTVLTRWKRQAVCNRKSQFRCKDGTCISFADKCDGIVNCPDGSDETFPLCRSMKCQRNWFRCTYGACVDGTAPCNGIQDCADNSDELLPRCRNEQPEKGGSFTCQDGQLIDAANHCDGVPDCADGSDETVRACAGKTCPSYLFQCAYGACVDQGANCNNKKECADGSDESDELCNSQNTGSKPSLPSGVGNCILPPYPSHGHYVVGGAPNASPGQAFISALVNVTCMSGYGVVGENSVFCYNGIWLKPMPQCVKFCKLSKHPSVQYRCRVNENGVLGFRDCNDQEPSGTEILPECNTPNYYYPYGVLSFMHCIDGNWDYVAICSPECGRVTPSGEQLIIDGRSAKKGELPWHAGIYRKTTDPYMQICGGSLVSTSAVVSAGHCFWTDLEGKLPADRFAVAVGKIYRPYNNPKDEGAQKSDVKDIMVPSRFQGAAANFQDDIAIVILVTPVVYQVFVRPVCVSFDVTFDTQQLTPGNMGKVAGWGLTAANGNPSQILKVVEVPYVSIEECIAMSPPDFREHITSDKICAGYNNGTALCKGDSGGGLVFPSKERTIDRYYLRGVVSTAPKNDDACNAYSLTSFTQIIKHEHFIRQHVKLD